MIKGLVKFSWALLLAMAVSPAKADLLDQSPKSWPRELAGQSIEITLYQPTYLKREDDKLFFDMAFAVKSKGEEGQSYGDIQGQCELDSDDDAQQLRCQDIQFSAVNFPLNKDSENELRSILQSDFSKNTLVMTDKELKHLLKLSEIQNKHTETTLENDPPKIYVAEEPTALISIDGKPVMRKIPDTTLMRVINTPYTLIFDIDNGNYYLRAGKEWREAKNLEEKKWAVVEDVPKDLKKLESQFKDEGDEDSEVDNFIIAMVPAALITTDGKPEFSKIQDTDLLAVTNTSSMVFLMVKTQNFYALISGRWYSADELSSAADWSYVPFDQLPDTFSKIPADSDYASVLTSIPKTPEAKEAAIRNEVPTVASVEKSKAKLNVTYDGKAQFEEIESTPMRYAVNSETPVIYYDNRYYANRDAIWFSSASPYGPWLVTDYLPYVIYSIPASHPLYRLTFSYVYGSYGGSVYFGYTPGYLGSYVTPYGTVVFGTGYNYRPWIGTYYYGVPFTWGFNYYYNPYYGWYNNSPYLWVGTSIALGWVSRSLWYDNWYPYHWYKRHDRWHDRKNVYHRWDKEHVKWREHRPSHHINDKGFKAPKHRRPEMKSPRPYGKKHEARPIKPEHRRPGERPGFESKKPSDREKWTRPKKTDQLRPEGRPKDLRDKGRPEFKGREPKRERVPGRERPQRIEKPTVKTAPVRGEENLQKRREPERVREPKIKREPPRVREPQIKREPPRVRQPQIRREPPRVREPQIRREPPRVREPKIRREPPRVRQPQIRREPPRMREQRIRREAPRIRTESPRPRMERSFKREEIRRESRRGR